MSMYRPDFISLGEYWEIRESSDELLEYIDGFIYMPPSPVTKHQRVIPDISILCDKSGFTAARYVGVPNLVVEILSPSNQSHDLITKLNLYRVKEYWIINPMLNAITVNSLNADKMYEQHDMKTESGNIASKFLDGFSVDLEYLFSEGG